MLLLAEADDDEVDAQVEPHIDDADEIELLF